MKSDDLLSPLRQYQTRLLQIIRDCPGEDLSSQFHADLSPLGWHLGHCVFTESFWLREEVMGVEVIRDEEKALYIPELSVKSKRGTSIPDKETMIVWAEQTQKQNNIYLQELMENGSESELMRDNYLLFFLCQHYAQHIETAHYVLTQQKLQHVQEFEVMQPLHAEQNETAYLCIETSHIEIGANNILRHYDNECPAFETTLTAFEIAPRPVTNAEYLAFIQDGGYDNTSHWSDEGQAWLENQFLLHPQHWRLDLKGEFYGTNAHGPFELRADDCVSGVSFFEAEAYAHWAGASLPHETQWELAVKSGVIEHDCEVWEWCSNSFMPYEGFKAFPYEGYSIPWFDGQHQSLRGGSPYTLPIIRRPEFRNFYQKDKRHFPAGLRLVRNQKNKE